MVLNPSRYSCPDFHVASLKTWKRLKTPQQPSRIGKYCPDKTWAKDGVTVYDAVYRWKNLKSMVPRRDESRALTLIGVIAALYAIMF